MEIDKLRRLHLSYWTGVRYDHDGNNISGAKATGSESSDTEEMEDADDQVDRAEEGGENEGNSAEERGTEEDPAAENNRNEWANQVAHAFQQIEDYDPSKPEEENVDALAFLFPVSDPCALVGKA